MKNNIWEIKGYYAETTEGKQAILLPEYCDNCKKRPINKIKKFTTFLIKDIIFYEKTSERK